MNDRERWWNRFNVQVASVRQFVSEARTEEQLEALDAFQDILDKLREELLEETQKYRLVNRAAYLGSPLRGIHPRLRPAASTLASWLSRTALDFEWMAAGLRARLEFAEDAPPAGDSFGLLREAQHHASEMHDLNMRK